MSGWWRWLKSAVRGSRPHSRDPVAYFSQGLANANPDVRAGAARKLGELGPEAAPAAVPLLVKALEDPDGAVRSSAALSLGSFGEMAAPAVNGLVRLLADPDDDVRSSAGIALLDIGPPAREAVEAALESPDPMVRAEAANIWRRLGPKDGRNGKGA
ncbi:MAG: HEAT repeat domain-containing protein [Firmicutes bacterium]|nr:HEAT repeat domain-containing protein [Bacillota bacterium]